MDLADFMEKPHGIDCWRTLKGSLRTVKERRNSMQSHFIYEADPAEGAGQSGRVWHRSP
jgi:hypothetical protein